MYTQENLSDKLVQYKGGGYDGCFWEWNYFIVRDSQWDVQFYDMFSSGRQGIKSLDKALDLLNHESSYYEYDLTHDDLLRFARESNEGHVLGVAKFLYDNLGIELYVDCSICENEFLAYDGELSGYEGCGGIAIQATELICEDCQINKRCENCNELDKSTEYIDTFDLSLCVYCLDDKTEQLNEEKQAAFELTVNHQALINGHMLSVKVFDNAYCINCKAGIDYDLRTMDYELTQACNK